ncbi:hypothetical protein DERP_003121 [Dermatophagoides pteronyssinus]|uniref:Uncharacterized protein n=1 Tax=Dermatophagoides pteronyssinus TaxID=6956 RepID=A0ABQ8JJ59_DERPT|nr:hypothetical protein DERP_003121 [Dermatophagoides pteronyssinus]
MIDDDDDDIGKIDDTDDDDSLLLIANDFVANDLLLLSTPYIISLDCGFKADEIGLPCGDESGV